MLKKGTICGGIIQTLFGKINNIFTAKRILSVNLNKFYVNELNT
jgi:hypothetical protein